MIIEFKDRFTKHTIFMFFAASFGSVTNLIYRLIIARGLSITDLAILGSLISLFTITAIPFSAFTTMVVRYSSMYRAQDKLDKLRVLLHHLFKHNVVISLSFALLIFIFRHNFSAFLKLDSDTYIIFIAVIMFFSGILPVIYGSLQGLEKFYWMGSISIVNGITKILATIIFLMLGWRIVGALSGFLLATLLCTFLSLVPIRRIFTFVKNKLTKEKLDFKKMYFYLIPTVLFNLAIYTLIDIDMILVKHYFSGIDAGYYALAQIIGKIIFFLPGAIVIVMFPRISSLHTQDREHLEVLKKALFFSAGLCLLGVAWYNLFPTFTLKILTGKTYHQSIQLGRLFCIAMSFFSLTNLLSFYHLSISNFRFIKYLIIAALLQIVAIVLFHQSLFIVLVILCINAMVAFIVNFRLVFSKKSKIL